MPTSIEISRWSRLRMTFILLQLPFILLIAVLKLSLGLNKSHKTRARVLFDTSVRFILKNLDAAQLQALSVPTFDSYRKWAKDAKKDVIVDELGSDARLLWVGSKIGKRVIIYCHGGGFVGPLSDFQIAFWHRIQQSLVEETGEEPIAIAILQYSLAPAKFPTQVNQLTLAIQHVLSLGVSMSDLYLAGDSAGANLALQHIICTLHLTPSVPQNLPSVPLAGVCMVSPWVILSNTSFKSHKENARRDLAPPKSFEAWAKLYLSGLTADQKPYADQTGTSPDWLAGIEKVVKRVIITSGNDEVLRDSITHFAKTMEHHHSDVTVAVLDGEVHADPLFDFATKPNDLTAGGKQILEWFRVGLNTSSTTTDSS